MKAGRPIIAPVRIGIVMRRPFASALLFFVAIGATAPAFADDKAVCFSLGSEDYKDKDKLKIGEAAIYRARGNWHQKKGELDLALADQAEAIKFEPKNAENYDFRGDVFRQKGDLDRALSDYDRASKLDPGYVSAYYSRGRVFEMKKDLDRARAEFNAAIKLPAKDRIAQWAQDNARLRLKAMDEDEKEAKKK
jgi:tetratricopeptide (TPR) repeat protein